MTMGLAVSQAIRTGTGPVPTDDEAGDAKEIAEWNAEAVVGRWVVIRVIRVIRLIRDSDTDGWRGEAASRHASASNAR